MMQPVIIGQRLTADDWIRAGFSILAERGPNALKIGPLCERLQVTKGSFYWHFADMRAYRTALAGAWVGMHDARGLRLDHIRDQEPRQRLALLMQTLVRPDHWALERAMRVWALTDETVLASVQRSDARVLDAVREALVDFGFDDDEAELRASLLVAAGAGLLHTARSAKDVPEELRERVLDFMLRR